MYLKAYLIFSFLLVAACGGGGGGGGGGMPDVIDPRMQRLAAYEAQNLQVLGDPANGVDGMPISNAMNIPTSGSLSFAGNVSIRVENGPETGVIFGDAEMSFDFQAGNGAGRMFDFFFGGPSGSTLSDYDGEIALSSDEATQEPQLSYQGTLTQSGEALVFDGEMDGMFLGEGVEGFVGSDLEADILQNGTLRTGTVLLITTVP